MDFKNNFFKIHLMSFNNQNKFIWEYNFYICFLNKNIYFALQIRGSLNKFPDFFRTDTFIDSTHMKL